MDNFIKIKEIDNVNNDYCHGENSHVKIYDYKVNFEKHILIGKVYFTKYSANHVGTCHGGAICAVIDDVVGWLGYCSGNKCNVGSGFTAQINTTLKKPVKLGSTLNIIGIIDKIDGRKVWVKCSLEDETNSIFCTGKGLFIKNN